MMRFNRAFMLRLLSGALLVLIAAVGCSDPVSDIGTDLVGGNVEPELRNFAPTQYATEEFVDITGLSQRVLTGMVDDPLFGSISVTGYLDFTSGFQGTAPSLTGAALQLTNNYIYGDTMSMITVALHDITDSWDATGAKADTTLMIGPEIVTHTFLSTDSVVTIPLPMTWVDTYADTLRSSNADSLFHGFALIPSAGQTVVGYTNVGTSLQVYSADDTTAFPYQTAITTVTRNSDPIIPEGRAAVQDGAGPTVRLQFDLQSMMEQPINGAVLILHADTMATMEAPEHFVRPMINELRLVAVREEGPAVLVSQVNISDEGVFSFIGTDIYAFFYDVLFRDGEYEYLELRAPVLNNTMSVLLLYDGSDEEHAPVLRFILGT